MELGILMKLFCPLKLYADVEFPTLSLANVALFTTPLFPFPLSSFALPLNGHHPTSPLVGTYDGTCAKALLAANKSAVIKLLVFIFIN
jgi:hypothetical protein